MSLPTISIITPSLNQGVYLEDTIRSVITQEYPRLEYIIIDGGSKDDSVNIISRYREHITYWSSEPDQGQSDALNKGFARATGDIIGWLNSDDIYQPGTLFKVAEVFKDGSVNIAMSEYFGFIDERGEIYDFKKNDFRDRRTLIRYWRTHGMTINQPCVFFRRSLIDGMRPVMNTTLHYAMDYDLWLRLSCVGHFHVIPGHWANYRFHDESKSGTGFDKFYPEWHVVSRRHWGKRYSREWIQHWFSWYCHIKKRMFTKALKKLANKCKKLVNAE